MKVALCEIKKNLQGTNSDGKETRTQINSLEQKEEIDIQREQNEETRIKKKKIRSLRTSRTSSNVPTSESQGCEKEKSMRKKVKTYLNK